MRFPMSTGLDFMGVVNRMLVPQAVLHCLVFRIVFGDVFRRPVCVWPSKGQPSAILVMRT